MSEQPRVPAAPSPNPHGGEFASKFASKSNPHQERAKSYNDAKTVHMDALNNMVPLTSEQKQAVKDYASTGGFYNALANKLRGTSIRSNWRGAPPKPEAVDAAIKHLDDAIAKQKPSTKETVLYRGISLDDMGYEGRDGQEVRVRFAKEVGTIKDNSYTSMTTDKVIAEGFGTQGANYATLRIRIPKGTRTLPIAGGGNHSGEQFEEREMLLPRQSKIRIISVGEGDDEGWIDAELVP